MIGGKVNPYSLNHIQYNCMEKGNRLIKLNITNYQNYQNNLILKYYQVIKECKINLLEYRNAMNRIFSTNTMKRLKPKN